MSEPCDVVVERVALGEPLGDLAAHAASCARCRRIAVLPAELGAAHREPEPGAGFSARMTAGAQNKLGVRRRQKIAAGVAVAMAAATIVAVVLVRRPADDGTRAATAPSVEHPTDDKSPSPPAPDDLSAERDLLHLARAARKHTGARWKRIERPLAPYQTVVKGAQP